MNYKTSGPARKLIFLLMIASVICSCTTTLSKKASLVREAKEYSVEDCEFLGTVQGWSGWGDRAQGVGIHNARNQALERAASLGATHIVWVDIQGGLAPVARARAYSCKQREQTSTVSPSPETSNIAGKGKSEKAATSAAGTLAKEKLAVMNLKAKHGVKESLAEGLSVVIRDTIQGFGNYEVISKEDVEVVAERTAIRQSLGCDDTECLINIGRSLGTRFMVAGALSKFGGTYNVSLRLIDTVGKEAGVKKRVNRNCECAEDELIEIAQVTAYLLLGRYSLQIYNPGQPPQSGKVK
jgi:TolB-like protein